MNGGSERPQDDDGAKRFGNEPGKPSAGAGGSGGAGRAGGGTGSADGVGEVDGSGDDGGVGLGSWGDDAYLDELFGPRPGAADPGAADPGSADDRPLAGRSAPIPLDDDSMYAGPPYAESSTADFADDPREASADGPPGLLQLIAGDLLLTFGGLDGTDAGPMPAGDRPAHPSRLPGSAPCADPVPLGRGVEIAELSGLLRRGTSVRIGGPTAIGRTTLLHHLAAIDPAQAPAGVVLLNGRRRSLDDLLQQLHDACFGGRPYRPTRAQSGVILADVAALVVVDDLELSQDDVVELLRMAPECAFLLAGPEVVDPIVRRDSPLHEITLGGLPQDASFDLLRRVAGRELDDEELAWASALWFQVGGHPGRFVQAGALLARRERGRTGYGLLDDGAVDTAGELPSPGEPRQFVPRLVPLLSSSAQQVLRLASALDGELPDPVHLPALTGAVDAVGAADELVDAGLAVHEYGRYRLAGGTADAVAAIVRGPSSWAVAAIQHFTWWVSHPSVTPADVAREADSILACLREAERLGKAGAARGLARAAAPAFGASARWDVWGEALDLGLASARDAGAAAAADHAFFRHELAILALCTGDPVGAREEAVAATRMRDVGSDKRGLAADRRVLALAGGDRAAAGAPAGTPAAVGATRGGIGRRGVLMTAGAAAVLVVTLAAVVGMGSDSSDDGDRDRNPVGSTGSVSVDVSSPGHTPPADPKVDRDKPAPPASSVSRRPGAGGPATATITATTRQTTTAPPPPTTASAPGRSAGATTTSPRPSPGGGQTSPPPSKDPTSAPPPTTTPPVTATSSAPVNPPAGPETAPTS